MEYRESRDLKSLPLDLLKEKMTELSEKFGFVFVGSHPMAGKETNGFDVSDADLYKNASYIIVPCKADNSVVNMMSDFA